MRAFSKLSVAVVAGSAAFLQAPQADACGGLFCNTNPVDQNAERVLFEVHDDGQITAIVEISYSGDAEDFSWVVPVPDTPSLDIVPLSALRVLDSATAPRFISPPTRCGGGFGLFANADSAFVAGGDARSVNDGGVIVEDLPQVGPFDPEVISSGDAELLVEWLTENGYLITPEMEPMVASYVASGLKFLGMKLAPEAGVNDISPIKMTYDTDVPGVGQAAGLPVLPLVLTAVAAEPEMGVIVFVLGNQRFEAANYANIEVDTDMVFMSPRTRQNNYYPLVSWLIDQNDGQAFITEMAAPTAEAAGSVQSAFIGAADAQEASGYILDTFSRNNYVTRLYTRISGWEMLADPAFRPSAGGDVSQTHDLSDRPEIDCDDDVGVPCGDTYCGVGALCGVTAEGIEGCVCTSTQVGRSVTVPGVGGAKPGVYCQERGFDMMASVAGADTVACLGVSCGDNGRCVGVGGSPTCECDAGFAAIPGSGSAPVCAAAVETFGPDRLIWAGCGCSGAGIEAPLGLAVLVLLRRRRKRR